MGRCHCSFQVMPSSFMARICLINRGKVETMVDTLGEKNSSFVQVHIDNVDSRDTSNAQQPTDEDVDEVKNQLLPQFARICYLIDSTRKAREFCCGPCRNNSKGRNI
ncbi:hypothetical protein LINGRAHAP2_LOCUS9269 [Linum grandiflorum]